jgi:hypothetical protein
VRPWLASWGRSVGSAAFPCALNSANIFPFGDSGQEPLFGQADAAAVANFKHVIHLIAGWCADWNLDAYAHVLTWCAEGRHAYDYDSALFEIPRYRWVERDRINLFITGTIIGNMGPRIGPPVRIERPPASDGLEVPIPEDEGLGYIFIEQERFDFTLQVLRRIKAERGVDFFVRREGTAPPRLTALGANGARRGHKPKSFWPDVERHIKKKFEHHGPLSPDDPEWSRQADVERAITECIEGNGWSAAESTIRNYAAELIAKFSPPKGR